MTFDAHLTSFQKGKSILDNARIHLGQEIIVKFDLERFFESITQEKILGVFRILGYNTSVAIELARACCLDTPQRIGKLYEKGSYACLPQGSPASPMLSNLSGAMLDLRLIKYAKSRNLNFSRYADDITFSGTKKDKPKLSTIGAIVESEGFKVNASKTKYVPSNAQQLVTGLVVNKKLSVPNITRRKIHTHIHNCLKVGPYTNLEKNGGLRLNYREWLLGNIIYIQMVHPIEGRKMKDKFDQIDWL